MKKILQILLLLLFSIKIFGQLDREHWFAPMMDRSGQTNPYQSIYMSTNETTPFKVDIYSNDKDGKSVIIGTVVISKNNPGRFILNSNVSGEREKIITKLQADLFKPINKGIYLKGEKPFFSNFRFSVNQHAEIITSKGSTGMGTEFFATPAPIEANLSNVGFMTSIMAQKDGTVITINNFNSSVQFSDGVKRSSFNITLNQGQSYIIDGRIADGGNNMTTNPNKYGFIGAKITSNVDHPITVTNGNFNGQYVSTTDSSTDILMDQSVPVDRLGKEFVMVKGNGTIYQPSSPNYSQNMEKGFIVATVNGTNVYVNDETTPVNPTPLNAGQYFVIPSEKYKLQGSSHRNMYIKSTENIYVFQLLAGFSGNASISQIATGGYNYIPPLSCYLPKEIDEIGLVSENEGYKDGAYNNDPIPTKLNIITEKGASVTVERNGVPFNLIPDDGPFDLTGNNSWVTYSISRSDYTGSNSVTGNMKVKSTKAVTAGISAGDGAVGYGGYFAGFSSTPLILKTEGDCLPGVKLAVTEGFDSYKWYNENDPTTVLSTTYFFSPSAAGIYYAKIQQGSCPEIRTQDFKFYNCTTYTNVDYETCSTLSGITPVFSLSSQNVVPGTVTITTPPTKGQATVVNGKINYTANPGASGIDTFKYSYCGDGAIPDCEVAQATIQINQIVAQDAILRECTSNGIATYDLRNANVTADTSATKVYYHTSNGAQNQIATDEITNFTAFSSADTIVYVRITNSKKCFAIQKIELKSKANPVVQENLYVTAHCDEEDGILDNNYVVNPNDITPVVLANPTTFFVKYYDSKQKADTGGTDNITSNYIFTATTAKIWIRVESSEGCVTVKEIALKIGNKIPLLTDKLIRDVCDKGFDNVETITLASYLPQLTSAASPTGVYYKTMPDALNGQNSISDSQTLSMGVTETFYYVVKNASFCADVATVNLTLIMGGQASTSLPASITICEDATTTLDAGTAHVKFQWFDENDPTHIIPSTQKVTLGPGKYYVILTSVNGCEYKQEIEIIGSPKAILDISKLNATFCDEDLDDTIKLKFSTDVTPVILQNPHPDLKVEYYKDAAYLQPITTDNFSYKVDTKVYVRVVSKYCSDVFGMIDFKIGNKIPLASSKETTEVCDDDFDGKLLVQNLDKYIPLFTTDVSATAKFYVRETDAKNNAANNITEINVNQEHLLYVRFSNTTDCSALGELTIKIKVPKKSDIVDKTICPDDTTDLDAGMGFDTYDWYKESDPTSSIGNSHIIKDLPVGKYFVILTGFYPNDCPYPQKVEIKAAEQPTIDGIEINGSTVKIVAKGGKEPYKYALDSGSYQDSNVFTNVSPGLHDAYVVSADDCDPVTKNFSVIEIYNLISPNGDGINDVLDMSLLKYKVDVKFQVFDREGRKFFDGNPTNNYIWDGKQNGKVLPTSSYWYIMEWRDFDKSPPVKYTGWILLKNRNSE